MAEADATVATDSVTKMYYKKIGLLKVEKKKKEWKQ